MSLQFPSKKRSRKEKILLVLKVSGAYALVFLCGTFGFDYLSNRPIERNPGNMNIPAVCVTNPACSCNQDKAAKNLNKKKEFPALQDLTTLASQVTNKNFSAFPQGENLTIFSPQTNQLNNINQNPWIFAIGKNIELHDSLVANVNFNVNSELKLELVNGIQQLLNINIQDITYFELNKLYTNLGRFCLDYITQNLNKPLTSMFSREGGFIELKLTNFDTDFYSEGGPRNRNDYSGLTINTTTMHLDIKRRNLERMCNLCNQDYSSIQSILDGLHQLQSGLVNHSLAVREKKNFLVESQNLFQSLSPRLTGHELIQSIQNNIEVSRKISSKSTVNLQLYTPRVPKLNLGFAAAYDVSQNNFSVGVGNGFVLWPTKPWKNCGVVCGVDLHTRFSCVDNFRYSGFGIKAFLGVGLIC